MRINLLGFFSNRFHFKLNESSSFDFSSELIDFLHPLNITLAVSTGMSPLAIIVRAIFKLRFLQFSLVLLALMQVARLRLKSFIIYNLLFSLIDFTLFLKFFNIKNFIIVYGLIIHACMLTFMQLEWFSFVNLWVVLNVFVFNTFVVIVDCDCLIIFDLFGILFLFFLLLTFILHRIIWLRVIIKFLFFSTKSSLLLLRVSDDYMAAFSFYLIEKFLGMTSYLCTRSCSYKFLNFLPIFSKYLKSYIKLIFLLSQLKIIIFWIN